MGKHLHGTIHWLGDMQCLPTLYSWCRLLTNAFGNPVLNRSSVSNYRRTSLTWTWLHVRWPLRVTVSRNGESSFANTNLASKIQTKESSILHSSKLLQATLPNHKCSTRESQQKTYAWWLGSCPQVPAIMSSRSESWCFIVLLFNATLDIEWMTVEWPVLWPQVTVNRSALVSCSGSLHWKWVSPREEQISILPKYPRHVTCWDPSHPHAQCVLRIIILSILQWQELWNTKTKRITGPTKFDTRPSSRGTTDREIGMPIFFDSTECIIEFSLRIWFGDVFPQTRDRKILKN